MLYDPFMPNEHLMSVKLCIELMGNCENINPVMKRPMNIMGEVCEYALQTQTMYVSPHGPVCGLNLLSDGETCA